MKIGIFTNNYLPNPYGVTGSIESFRLKFEALWHNVHIFAPSWAGYTDSNQNVYRFPSFDLPIRMRFPIAIPYSKKIDAIIKNLDLDIIHAQHPNLIGSVASRWAKKKKIPLVFTWHTRYDLYTDYVPFLPSKFSAWYMVGKARKFANKADMVIVPTESMMPILEKWGIRTKMVPIATCVDEKQLSNAEGQIVRKKYGVREDEALLLVVTRLAPEKNIEFLFLAVCLILKKNPRVKFLVVAGGYLQLKLEKIVEQENLGRQVIFAGHVSNEEKKNYYAAADIFVFSSLSETQGMVITEAMYMGLPIVAVKAPGPESLVVNDQNGLLVENDAEKFATAVERLVDNRDLRLQMGQVSKKIAQEKYTDKICAAKMLEVYNSLLKQ